MPSQDRIPDRLGPYRLRERIGEGGMGAVYLARDQERRPVAVKVLHSRVADEPTARRRLAREVEAMRRVRSPYVAEVLDADVTGRYPYIVTRYVPGHTLDHLVRQQGPLGPAALERLASGLAEALVAVHAAGIVHRDLKPGNVMMSDGSPVVIDFGIAHTGDSTRLTQTGMFMGTPGYLAPEVIEGQPSSEASDVHSWGATVAYAATGRPPFGSGSFETIFYRIVQGRADIGGMPEPLARLVSAALSRDPRHRPTAAWLHAQSASLGLASAAAHGASIPTVNGSYGADGYGGNGYGRSGNGYDGGGNGHHGAALGAAALGGAALGGAAAAAYGADPAAYAGAANGAWAGGLDPRGLNPNGLNPNGLNPNGRDPRGLDPNGFYPGGAEPARTLRQPEPIRPGEFADLLPPVQYAPSSVPAGAAQARPGAGFGPEGAAGAAAGYAPAGYPARGGPMARPAGPPGTAGPATPDRAAGAAQRARPSPLLGLAAMVIAVAVSVVLPIAGAIGSLAVITLLRAADRAQSALTVRRSVRGASPADVLVGVITAPWAIARSVLTLALLAPLALAVGLAVAVVTLIMVPSNALPLAGSYAAGAVVAFYGVGPGSAAPRRQVRRLFGAIGRTRMAAAVAALVMFALAAAAVGAATSQPPLYWPVLHWMLPHINLNSLVPQLHLPHFSIPQPSGGGFSQPTRGTNFPSFGG
jgi:predicted Ser/Thr protein kinase